MTGEAMGQQAASRRETQPTAWERLRQIIAERCYAKGRFVLASGRESTYYFYMKPAMLDAEGSNLLADLILDRIAAIDANYVGGLVMGAVPIAVAVALKSHASRRSLQAFWVRKEAKDHGAKSRTDGYLVDGSRVIIVEDVTTTGDSVMQAIDEVRRHHCEIAAVVTIVDRLEGAQKRLAAEKINFLALFNTRDFDPDFDPAAYDK
jgi:orotate phosphoribosyltransferase